MKQISLGKSGMTVPAVALGCMRIGDVSAVQARRLVETTRTFTGRDAARRLLPKLWACLPPSAKR